LALGLGLVYLVYYSGRTWIQSRRSASTGPSRQPTKRELKLQQALQIREWIHRRPATDRATELLGSLLVGAFACLVLNLLGLAIGESFFNTTIESWAVYAWLTTTSVFGCWAVLLISKIWEPRKHRRLFSSANVFRRLAMVLVGLSVGAVAFFTAGVFSIDLANSGFFALKASTGSSWVIPGLPILPAYLIFFAGLFGIIRWWLQADPTRVTRLNLVSVTLCLIWATVFSHVLAVPMIPNCILALAISVSVQLAAPWINPQQRAAICAHPAGQPIR
jgi:hypothetical protein